MSLAVRALLWLLLVVGVGTMAWTVVKTYNGKIERAAELQAALERERMTAQGWMATAAFWQAEKERADVAIAKRDQAVRVANQRTAEARANVEAEKQRSPEVKAWADTPLPPFIVEQLHSLSTDPGTTRDPAGDDSGKPTGPGRRAAMARFD